MILLTIAVYMDDKEEERDDALSKELSKGCAGQKPLVEHVQPVIYRRVASQMKQFMLRLKNASEEWSWSAPARTFQVS
jgi:hypothetical protein